MADQISNAIIQAVVERPISRAYEEIKSAFVDFKDNVESLLDTRATIEAVLLDADSVADRSHVEQVALEKLSCQLDRLVDFLNAREARAMRKQVMGGSRFIKEACLFFSPSNQLVSRFIDARTIKDIRGKLDDISREHVQFGSIVTMPPASQPWAWSVQTTASHMITDLIIGRDGDRENIISTIISDDSMVSQTLSVASIVGIGGMGKTMLARYVYCDERVKQSFDVRFWVDVNRAFDVKEVIEKIAACDINDQEPFMRDMDQPYHYHEVHDHFIRAISGKMFLLVLDNIWDQDGLRLKWINLQNFLDRFGARGSQVLITTRDVKVTGIMNSRDPHMLGGLTKADSWLLFQEVAFTQWQEPGMEAIGEEIASMCPDMPLVIRSVAGLLAGKRTNQEWQAFRDDQLANFASYGRDIMQTLKLSFDQLDAKSKLCAIYCSLFHKGFIHKRDTIVSLWIALGYVEPQYRNQSLEEAGDQIVINLLNCGFFQTAAWVPSGFLPFVVMHDVMHDLFVSLDGYKYKMADSKTNEFDKRVRHVSIGKVVADTSWQVPTSLFKIKHLQWFIVGMVEDCEIKVRNWSNCDDSLWRFQSLKVLMLHGVLIEKLPRSLCKLMSLRHLDLSKTAIVKVPNSVARLITLQSLNLYECKFLRELPKDLSKLVNLRHLVLCRSFQLVHMPTGLGRLTDLRTLDMFVVGEGSSHSKSEANAIGGLADLKELNNIQRKLKILVCRESKNIVSEARAANLKLKGKLTRFSIWFKYSTTEDEMVLEGLQPHANLESLEIAGYGGERLPRWMRDDQLLRQLPNLTNISIVNCKSCIHLCCLGRLPHLRRLFLQGLDNVEYIESNNSRSNANNSDNTIEDELFPSLKDLGVQDMPRLKGWRMSTSGNQALKQVTRIQDQHHLIEWKPACPKLTSLSVNNVQLAITLAESLLMGHTTPIHLAILRELAVTQTSLQQTLVRLNNCFPKLVSLSFSHIGGLKVLPEEFKDFSSLQHLDIHRCEHFQAIPDWIERLTALTSIYIWRCPKLESLPRQLSNLSKLRSLLIYECSSLLEERCRNPTGECWPFIQHIRCVNITTASL